MIIIKQFLTIMNNTTITNDTNTCKYMDNIIYKRAFINKKNWFLLSGIQST